MSTIHAMRKPGTYPNGWVEIACREGMVQIWYGSSADFVQGINCKNIRDARLLAKRINEACDAARKMKR